MDFDIDAELFKIEEQVKEDNKVPLIQPDAIPLPPKLVTTFMPFTVRNRSNASVGLLGQAPVMDSRTSTAIMAAPTKTSSIKTAGNVGNKVCSIDGLSPENSSVIRSAAGKVWEDPNMALFDEHDYRIFVGDLGNDVSDEMLARVFSNYTSLQVARVVRNKRTQKSNGYGFVSFKDPKDFLAALKEMNGKYCGNHPMALRKSKWSERSYTNEANKEKRKLLAPLIAQTAKLHKKGV